MTVLLTFAGARIEAGGIVLAASLDVVLAGPRAVIVGDARALIAALAGTAQLSAGAAEVLGEPLAKAQGQYAIAALDPPLLADLTPLAHVTWSARLAGLDAKAAEDAAAHACGAIAIGPWARRALAGAPLSIRRATVLAAAAVTGPALLVAESPLAGLDEAQATTVLTALGRLVGERAAIVSTAEPVPGTVAATLVAGASDVARL